MARANIPKSPVRCGLLLLLLAAPSLACEEGGSGAVRSEGTPCADPSDCAPFHLVCATPPGIEEGQDVQGICVKGIPSGSCAFYVREGRAAGKFCVD